MAELNGAPVERAQLQALALTNYGHFTTMRVENGGVRGLSRHLDRLRADSRALFDAELDTDRVRAYARRSLAGASPAIVRITVFDPELQLGHPGAEARPNVLVTTRAAADAAPPPLQLRSVRYGRDLPEIKHVGLFGALKHRRAAQRAGFDDALFTDADGRISEIATSNIGFVDGDQVVWPSGEQLPGVTQRLVAELAAPTTRTAPVTVAEAARMEAVFATNAAVGLRPVRTVDAHGWPERHPVLERLQRDYAAIEPEPL